MMFLATCVVDWYIQTEASKTCAKWSIASRKAGLLSELDGNRVMILASFEPHFLR